MKTKFGLVSLQFILCCFLVFPFWGDSTNAGALVYSTYLGGGNSDTGWGITVDSSGNAYITGGTGSPDFPTTSGAFDTSYNGSDVFVSKLNASGTALVYSTYLGGGNGDAGFGIAVDGSGNAYITGETYSSDFPTTPGAFDTSYSGFSRQDAFLTKLNPSGTALVYSTFLGGTYVDVGWGIAIDSSGNAYITGQTLSSNFPTTPNAFDTSYNGPDTNGYYGDIFVSKLNSSGTALVYSTYLGGGYDDVGFGIAIDSSRNAYITGFTESHNFPTTTGAFDTSFIGLSVYVTKLNSSGTALVYSTYLGGGSIGTGIALDSSGNAYITGRTFYTEFPTTPKAFDNSYNGGTWDAFVSKLNASGAALVYSTYLGSEGTDMGENIALDSLGNAYITGFTNSFNFPTTPGAFNLTYSYNTNILGEALPDVFVSKLNANGSALVYSTYLGGGDVDWVTGIAVDGSRNASITGWTDSADFPTTVGALDTSYNGSRDAFVSKLSMIPYVKNIPDIKLLIGHAQSAAIELNRYLVENTTADWSWSSKNILTNLSIDQNSWVDYLTPISQGPSLDTVTFLAVNIGGDNSILKYSTYLLKRLPDAIIDNGRKLLNCDIDLANYISKDTWIEYPIGYPYEIRYSNSSDSGKLNITFSGNMIFINPTSALLDSAEVIVTATPSPKLVDYDWDKEIIHVYEILNSYGQFTVSSDTSHWYYQVYADGTGAGTLSCQSGILRITQTTEQKAKLSQIFTVPAPGWYTARANVATDIADDTKQQKVYLYLQEYSQDSVITACANQVIAPGGGGFGGSGNWKNMMVSFYTQSTILAVQVVSINSYSGISGSLYISGIWVYAAPPQVERCYGATKIAIANSNFDTSTAGWLVETYADGTGTGTWNWLSSWSGHSGIIRGTQSGGEKAKLSQLFNFSRTTKNASASVWVYSGATSQSNTQKVYLYLYSYDSGYTGIMESGNGILYAGQWAPGKWQEIKFGYTPIRIFNAVQFVAINPSGKPTASIYFDDISVNQDQDTDYYWDHTLF